MNEFELMQIDEEVENFFNGNLEYEELGPSARSRVAEIIRELENWNGELKDVGSLVNGKKEKVLTEKTKLKLSKKQ